MRLLAIRGANLASLADEFEVDLAAEPLASAGLFAITGATGAGKSTLLDAVCAALFNVTPRLEGRSRFEVGRDGGSGWRCRRCAHPSVPATTYRRTSRP